MRVVKRLGRPAVMLGWLLLLIGLVVGAAATGPAADEPVVATPRAQEVLDRLDERIPGAGDPTGWIVYREDALLPAESRAPSAEHPT